MRKPAHAEKRASAKPISPTITRAADHRAVYVNHARLAMTPYDIQFHAGHTVDDGSGNTVVEEAATIVMSPIEAKAVALMLSQAVQQYEATFGKIPAVDKLVGGLGKSRTTAPAPASETIDLD